MKVYRDAAGAPAFTNAVITIGTFDGVHTGHQQVIHQLRQEAAAIHGESVIITFDPHPRKIIGTGKELKLINTLEEKIELLEQQGVDHLAVIPFTSAFSQLTPEAYIRDFLVAQFHPHTIIIGYDHRFGKARAGNYQLMETFSAECRYRLQEIPVHVLNLLSVSSTRIRAAIAEADIQTANELLGYAFFFEGRVVPGNRLGRTLGYPTANLQVENSEKITPGDGIYAVQVHLHPGSANPQKLYKGMMSIGIRPTIGASNRVIEVNIFDFDGDLYGKNIRVYVKKYLRPEIKFDGLEALKEQLRLDAIESLKELEQE